jgi:hypothetical protein
MDENEKRESVVRRPDQSSKTTKIYLGPRKGKSENFSWEHWNRVTQ